MSTSHAQPLPRSSQLQGLHPLTHRGFLSTLFDLPFSASPTTKIVKAVHVLTIAVIGLVALLSVIAAFQLGSTIGFLALFAVAPVTSLLDLMTSEAEELTAPLEELTRR